MRPRILPILTAVALTKDSFDALIARSPAFRRLVFNKYASRMTRLMELVEDVAFQSIDTRLARKLLELAHGTATLDITHQSLAVELGTAREVVSRHIKRLCERGLLLSSRGHIQILDGVIKIQELVQNESLRRRDSEEYKQLLSSYGIK